MCFGLRGSGYMSISIVFCIFECLSIFFSVMKFWRYPKEKGTNPFASASEISCL